MNIIFCHTDNSLFKFNDDKYSSNSLPYYFFESARQARHVSQKSKIFLICNPKNITETDKMRLRNICVDVIDQNEYIKGLSKLYELYINTDYDRSLANFNFTGISRYFIVENFIEKNGLENVLYMEYDNLIYFDPHELTNIFNHECMMSKVNDERMCCGIAFFKDHHRIKQVNDKIIEILDKKPKYYINDMFILSEIYRTTDLIDIFNRFPEQSDIIVDPCSYGQYIGGTNNGSGPRFTDDSHDVGKYIKSNKIKFIFHDYVKVINGNIESNIFALHVHNKKVISDLTTYDKSQIDGDFFEYIGRNNKQITYSEIDNVENVFGTQNEILITHNGDRNITEDLYSKFKQKNNFRYWFAQNTRIKKDNLITLPIGLERKRNCPINKFRILLDCKELFNEEPEGTLYANFSIGTKQSKRYECIRSFEGKAYLTNKVQFMTPSSRNITEEQYREYCNDILNHKFVLCPEGNGIDTHRFWETLYLGRIPVVLHNCVNDSFSDMPVLILDKWEDFENHMNDNISGSYDKLTRKYWYNKILNI